MTDKIALAKTGVIIFLTGVVIYLWFKIKPVQNNDVTDSPVKTMYTYNIPPLPDYNYTAPNLKDSCGCKAGTTPSNNQTQTQINVTDYIDNMQGYIQ